MTIDVLVSVTEQSFNDDYGQEILDFVLGALSLDIKLGLVFEFSLNEIPKKPWHQIIQALPDYDIVFITAVTDASYSNYRIQIEQAKHKVWF